MNYALNLYQGQDLNALAGMLEQDPAWQNYLRQYAGGSGMNQAPVPPVAPEPAPQEFQGFGNYANPQEMEQARRAGIQVAAGPDFNSTIAEVLQRRMRDLQQPVLKTTQLVGGGAFGQRTDVDRAATDQNILLAQQLQQSLKDAEMGRLVKQAQLLKTLQGPARAARQSPQELMQEEFAKGLGRRAAEAPKPELPPRKRYEAERGAIPAGFEVYAGPEGELATRPAVGSKPYLAATQAINAYTTAQKDMQQGLEAVEALIKHPAREAATGWSGTANPLFFAGERRGFLNDLATLGSQTFLANIGKLRGTGPLSNVEGEKLQSAIANLDPSSDDATFKKNLELVKARFQATLEAARAEAEEARSMLGRNTEGNVGGQLVEPAPPRGNAQQLLEEARQAIARGADPAKVHARLQQLGIQGGL